MYDGTLGVIGAIEALAALKRAVSPVASLAELGLGIIGLRHGGLIYQSRRPSARMAAA
jgi:hypothetical protein